MRVLAWCATFGLCAVLASAASAQVGLENGPPAAHYPAAKGKEIVQHSARSRLASADYSRERIAQEIQRRLSTLPFYTVFDNLTFRFDGGDPTLLGQVTSAVVKTDAENAVKSINGVNRVENQIEVLPLSAQDEKLRLAEYLAIYGQPGLNEYALRAAPPVHIIVQNGNVTLEGSVSMETDKTLAFTQASTVPGVKSLTDHLMVKASLSP